MQITHDVDDDDYEYPVDLPVKDVNVYIHPSLMVSTHDYSCPVCRKNHAVLNGNNGVMGPCWDCRKLGWNIVKVDKRNWFTKLLNIGQPKYE